MSKLLTQAVLDAAQWYEVHYGPLPDDVKAVLSRRDKREPGRKRKELADTKLASILRRMFRKQSELVKRKLKGYDMSRKAVPTQLQFDLEMDDADMAELIAEIVFATRDGINLFDEDMNLTLDYTVTNTEAAEWARKYAYDLVKDINSTTVLSLKQAISAFVETPGMTIGDVMNLLPFDDQRAMRVAVTEITRSYAQGQQMAGEALKEEYPDVKVVKKWYTNEDDKVCELCGPLGDGDWIPIDEDFYEPEPPYQDGNPPRHVNCRCWLAQSTEME